MSLFDIATIEKQLQELESETIKEEFWQKAPSETGKILAQIKQLKGKVENTIVIGTGTNSKNETENHAWNYVKLDGKWYAIDVTWDDPVITGGGKLTNKARYEYFLKGSQTMNKNHVPSGKFTQDGRIFEYPELSIEDYE